MLAYEDGQRQRAHLRYALAGGDPQRSCAGVGDPVKLDERWSQWTAPRPITAILGIFLSTSVAVSRHWLRVYTALRQSPRPSTCQ